MMLESAKAKVAFVLLVGLLSVGMVQAASPADCPTSTPQANEALAKSWVKTILGSEDDATDLLTENYVHNAGYARPVVEGREAYLKYRDEFFTGGTFTDWEATADQVFATNDRAVASWTVKAVYQKGLGGTAPAGTAVTWTGMTIIRPECGKVAEAWVEADSLSWLQQIGAVPTETP